MIDRLDARLIALAAPVPYRTAPLVRWCAEEPAAGQAAG